MNFVIGKFGKSILFDTKRHTSPIGGDGEPSKMFSLLARYNPQHNFYLIGKSDLSRCDSSILKKINPHNNIIDVWKLLKTKDAKTIIEYPLQYFKDNEIKIEAGIFFSGPAGNANIPDKIFKVGDGMNPGTEVAKVLEMFQNYVGPIVHFLNESNVPYFTITPDPRYHPTRARDLFNLSNFSISQLDTDHLKVKHIQSYDNQVCVMDTIKTTYNSTETIFMYQSKKPDLLNDFDKTEFMNLILNEGGNGGLERGPFLEEYILNNKYLDKTIIDNVNIYGKWKDHWSEKYKNFKGTILFSDIPKYFKNTKFTFIIPIEKGWVTAKFWECISNGIIPFLHPYYDEQNHLPKIAQKLKVKSPEDFAKKINYINDNPEKYNLILEELQKILKDDYYNGKLLLKELNKSIYKLGFNEFKNEITDEEFNNIDEQIKNKNKSIFDMLG